MCGKSHDNPTFHYDWLQRPYIAFCPHCRATREPPRFMELLDLTKPSLSFVERKQDPYVFWVGGENVSRRERPPVVAAPDVPVSPF